VIIVMVVAIARQLAVPDKPTMKPRWLLPAVETVLLMILARRQSRGDQPRAPVAAHR
jgi:hypothetical protein